MTTRTLLRLATVGLSTAVMVGISACGGGNLEGDLPETKPATAEQVKQDAAKIDMMKGAGYRGAPGAPPPPGGR